MVGNVVNCNEGNKTNKTKLLTMKLVGNAHAPTVWRGRGEVEVEPTVPSGKSIDFHNPHTD